MSNLAFASLPVSPLSDRDEKQSDGWIRAAAVLIETPIVLSETG
jgi:hypothetical protein